MSLQSEIQSLSPSALVELYQLDLTPLGGQITYFHAGTNQLGQSVVWQGNTYQPFPVKAEGFEKSGTGAIARPMFTVANVTGLITQLCKQWDDLIGMKVTRKRTFVRYLDAVNFPGGNPQANGAVEFVPDIFFVNRKVAEKAEFVQFELSSSMDVEGVKLPRRQVIANLCPWRYRSAECGYTGATYFTIDDTPAGNLASDVCGKRLASCKLRFGANGVLPFGGFPGAGLVR